MLYVTSLRSDILITPSGREIFEDFNDSKINIAYKLELKIKFYRTLNKKLIWRLQWGLKSR